MATIDLTAGGGCESCGAPNASVDLLALDPERYALRRRRRLVLDLERMRDELELNLQTLWTRAPLAQVIRERLGRSLGSVVLSVEGGRGVPLDFLGLPEQRLHASAEMFAAQRYGLESVAGPFRESDALVRFAGFGQGYLHAFVHGALGLAAVRCGLPCPESVALLTSQLRPSRGVRSVIWARELTDVFSSDAVRAYLALIGSDYAEAHFVRSVMDNAIGQIAASIEQLVQLWNDQRHLPEAGRAQYEPRDIAECMRRRLSLADFSGAELARRSLNCIDHLAQKCSRPRSGHIRYIPSVLALALEPLCPDYVGRLRDRFPEAARDWDVLTMCALDRDLPCFGATPLAAPLDRTTLARTPLTAAS